MKVVRATVADLGPGASALPDGVEPDPQDVNGEVSVADRWMMAGVAYAIVALAWVVTLVVFKVRFDEIKASPAPVEGLTIFAVFFVAAAGLERFLEPLADLMGAKPAEDTAQAIKDTVTKIKAATTDVGAKGAAEAGLREVAEKKAAAGQRSVWSKVIVWALASSAGILVAGSCKLYLLKTVGIATPPEAVDVLATGLIIGAGTKPLHDLTKLIEKKKEAAADPAAAAGG